MKSGSAAEHVKQRLVDRYLGVAGIHGIGLVRAGRALRVYCDPCGSAERQAVLEQLQRDAHPLEVEIISKSPPRVG